MCVDKCPHVCTGFIDDFSACGMPVTHMSNACGAELVADLYCIFKFKWFYSLVYCLAD